MSEKTAAATVPEFPGRYDTNDELRRMRFSARLFATVASASLFSNVVLAATLFALAPLKERVPYLVQILDKDSVVATIEPVRDTAPGIERLTESLAREYVRYRNEIVRSQQEMERRWGPNGILPLMQSPQESANFVRGIVSVYKELKEQDVTREIRILSSSQLSRLSIYQVEFEAIERDAKDQVIRRALYLATLEVTYEPKRIQGAEASFLNPTGFTVISYSVAEKRA